MITYLLIILGLAAILVGAYLLHLGAFVMVLGVGLLRLAAVSNSGGTN